MNSVTSNKKDRGRKWLKATQITKYIFQMVEGDGESNPRFLELKNFSLTESNIYETIWFMHAFFMKF